MQKSSLPEKNLFGDENVKVFVMYIISLKLNLMPIHRAWETQITLLVIEKVQISSKYLNFSDVFLEEKAFILPKAAKIKLTQHQASKRSETIL